MAGIIPGTSIPCPVRQMARQDPHHPAIVLDDAILDYRTLDERLNHLCQQLTAAGMHRGSQLLAISANSIELLLLGWACLRSGILFCPINPSLPQEKWQVLVSTLNMDGYWLAQDDGSTSLGDLRLTLSFDGTTESTGEICLEPGQLASLTLTSGSSGESKAVAHYLQAHLANAMGSAERIPVTQGDLWLLSLPLFHIGGYAIAIRCFTAGAAIALRSATLSLAQQLHQWPITHLSLVPTQLYRLFQAGLRLEQTRIRCLLLGGAAIPDALIGECQAQGITPYVSYGLSEMGSQVCTRQASAQGNNTGRPLPGREVRLDGEEICVRGETLFAGYYRDGQLQLPLDEQGWFHTGDLGKFNPQGELIITGRIGNRFISGGENIQPEEIEQQLVTHPAIRQAMVVPLADAEWGAAAVAFIDSQSPLAFSELKLWLKQRLPRHLIPRHWLPWPDGHSGGLKPSRQEFATLARGLLEARGFSAPD